MDNMKEIYIQEANELLENLEASLLVLERDAADKSNIEQVFRVMHTLKGNSSMFGLAVVTDFVHHLETIYDNIRQGQMELSKEILDATLAALDHLNLIIHDSELAVEKNRKNHEELLAVILGLIDDKGTPSKSTVTSTASVEQESEVLEHALKTFHVFFQPNEDLLHDGSNPMFYVADLAQLGKHFIIPHFKNVESIESFDPTTCIAYWDVLVETELSKSALLDVFMFIEGDAQINITEINYVDFVSKEPFKEALKDFFYFDTPVDVEDVIVLAKQHGVEVVKKEKTDKQENNSVSAAVKSSSQEEKKSPEKKISSIRVTSDKLDELMNLVSELVTTQASLTLFTEDNESTDLQLISENIEKLSRRLRDISFGMTLIPVDNLFSRFQRLIRDMCSLLEKDVDFITEGAGTELDKTIIETLTDPLMHILRNSMDHGIETPDVREANGKPRKGTVKLKAYYSGISVFIQIIDDGKGIDVEGVRQKAIEKGLINEGDELSNKEIFDFIFHPGFSTAKEITDVSGRGVGMDVVKRNITDLKGSISVESEVNVGTTLTIKLPLSLSIIDGLLVEVDKVNYIIPLTVVKKCYEISNRKMIGNFNRLLLLDEKQVPFINLREEFGHHSVNPDDNSQIIVVSDGDYSVGISVDFIKGEYQAVVKPIGKYYKNQDFVSGATILGDGSIALVLDTQKIIDGYVEHMKIEKTV
jgi:two-component system, chemotaxis family, sensor kinase CheA